MFFDDSTNSSSSSSSSYEEPGLGDNQTVTLLFWLAFPFSLLSCAVSAWGIYNHLTHFYVPEQQRYVVRILLMVPVYTFVSQIGIGFPWAARYLELLRDCYEAFVIYVFFMLLVEYIGGEQAVPRVFNARRLPEPGGEKEMTDPSRNAQSGNVDNDDDDEPPSVTGIHPSKPAGWRITIGRLLFFWRPENVNENPQTLFLSIKRGILQFVVLMPWISALTVISDIFSKLGEGDFSPEKSYIWLTIIHVISVTVAMVYLIRFYNIASHELKPYHPLPKFLCIKAVVFLSFYQNIVLAITFAVLEGEHLDYSATTLQNFMICIEMFMASIAHIIYFPTSEFMTPSLSLQEDFFNENEDEDEEARLARPIQQTTFAKIPLKQALLASFFCVDVYRDTVRTFGPRGQLVEPLIAPQTDSGLWKDEDVIHTESIWTQQTAILSSSENNDK